MVDSEFAPVTYFRLWVPVSTKRGTRRIHLAICGFGSLIRSFAARCVSFSSHLMVVVKPEAAGNTNNSERKRSGHNPVNSSLGGGFDQRSGKTRDQRKRETSYSERLCDDFRPVDVCHCLNEGGPPQLYRCRLYREVLAYLGRDRESRR